MALDAAALDALFREARTHNAWDSRPVTDEDLRAIFDLAKMGPTSANCSPARFVFVRTAEGKDKLRTDALAEVQGVLAKVAGKKVAKGVTATFNFKADKPGTYEVESHTTETVMLVIEVV